MKLFEMFINFGYYEFVPSKPSQNSQMFVSNTKAWLVVALQVLHILKRPYIETLD